MTCAINIYTFMLSTSSADDYEFATVAANIDIVSFLHIGLCIMC